MTPRAPYFSASWADAETGATGHLVIDALVRGVSGGGLRMRPGCTLEEVTDLARAMTRKEAIVYREGDRYLPLGGAKGGIDFDPYDPRARDVLGRYLDAMLPLLQTRWAAGEDMGVRQEDIDALVLELGMRSSVDSVLRLVHDGVNAGLERIDAGFGASERGIGLGDLVGGYGVAQAALEAVARLGREPAGATATVQGFGSMGGATARYLADAGVRVIAIADVAGLVVNEAGLDVEALLRTRDRHGRIDRATLRPGDAERPREEWSRIACDVLVPAAGSYAIDAAVAAQIDAAVIVEAANVATLPAAELALSARGVVVVPDFVANLATNAWWWWTVFGDVEPTVPAAFALIAERVRGLVGEALERTAPGVPVRAAAEAMADERQLARADAAAGVVG